MSETATYSPDATVCAYGHSFESEADCVMPEDWDRFMCRRCLVGAGLSTDPAAWDYGIPS